MRCILAGAALLVAPAAAMATMSGSGDKDRGFDFIGRLLGALQGIGWLDWILIAAGVLILAFLWWQDQIRPGSLRDARVRTIQRGDVWIFATGALVLFSATYLAGGLAGGFLDWLGTLGRWKIGPTGRAAAVNAIVYGVMIPASIVMLLMTSRAAEPSKEDTLGASLRGSDLWKGGLALLAIVPIVMGVMSFLVIVFSKVALGLTPAPVAHETLEVLIEEGPRTWKWWLLAGGAVIGAPIVEEALYRGLIQSALVSALRDRWVAILLTGLIFALIHMPVVPWHALAILFALGVAMGVAYERTGRLWLCIVIHAGFNAINLALAMWGTSGG